VPIVVKPSVRKLLFQAGCKFPQQFFQPHKAHKSTIEKAHVTSCAYCGKTVSKEISFPKQDEIPLAFFQPHKAYKSTIEKAHVTSCAYCGKIVSKEIVFPKQDVNSLSIFSTT
jgi:hypothetical protein